MTLLEVIAKANTGSLITRTSDKHADWTWRVTVPVDLADLEARLATLRNGTMLPVPGLERLVEGKWQAVGALMSHQAKADDWVVFSPTLAGDTVTNVRAV